MLKSKFFVEAVNSQLHALAFLYLGMYCLRDQYCFEVLVIGSILQKVLKEFCQFVGVGESLEKLKFKIHEALLKKYADLGKCRAERPDR